MTDMAELKSYLLFMQICGATGCSRFLTEGTTESRAVWVHVWAATGTRSASSPPRDRFGMVWRAPGGTILPESQSLFFPQAPAKIQKDTGSPSLADVVETMEYFSPGQLRSLSAYSLRIQAALRNAFVLGL